MAWVVSAPSSDQNCLSQDTVKPSMPGAEPPFILWKRQYLSSSSLISPSRFLAWCSGSLRIFKWTRGSESPSELRKFSMSSDEEYILSCLLYILWKSLATSLRIPEPSVRLKNSHVFVGSLGSK